MQITNCEWQKIIKMDLEKKKYEIKYIIGVNIGINGVLL